MESPFISIVTTLYRSESFLDDFVDGCRKAMLQGQIAEYEIVVVNDGSPDNSLKRILEIKKSVPELTVLDLSRNFGHHNAILAGLSHAKGDYVFLIDCDLEVPPSAFNLFYDEMKQGAGEYDVIYGYQEKRKGGFIERNFGGAFWKILNAISETKVPASILTERLMTRRYVGELIKLGDRNLFLGGMFHWVGFNQKGLPIRKGLRVGKSSYSFSKRYKLMVDAISSFTAYPLKMLSYVGLILTILSIGAGLYLIAEKLLYPDKILKGYTSLAVVILFSTGLIIASLGLVGLYLEKVFNQVKGRPLFIIKNKY